MHSCLWTQDYTGITVAHLLQKLHVTSLIYEVITAAATVVLSVTESRVSYIKENSIEQKLWPLKIEDT